MTAVAGQQDMARPARFPRIASRGLVTARRRVLWLVAAAALLLAAATPWAAAAAADPPPIRLKVAGGLADLGQYTRHEQPFWTERVPEITQGRVRAEIAPFDRSGIRGQEMLQLVRLGVVPFGNILLAVAAADDPELNGIDLPVLNPDVATLRRTVALWRPRLSALLRERYGVELLAVYTYPAQVMFCRRPFAALSDLAGRRVRTSSVGQSELLAALGAVPVVIPFADMVGAIRGGVVECAITAAMSGNAIGLHEVTSHLSRLAIGWGVSMFAANRAAWLSLPEEVRGELRDGLRQLEADIWRDAEVETENGLACNAGLPTCVDGRRGRMTVVEERAGDQARRAELVREVVLPSWVRRCGPGCAESWNRYIAPALGVWAGEKR
jgi:TRAP-type C4-dicarboxylate transport system substrate-binding protein